jgi:murein tripeptide amidase MpaA
VALRHRCSFVVIPMLNPDGSFLGNYRTCSLGTDLNRMWANPTEATEPTLFHTKELIRRLSEDDTVQLGKRERERERESEPGGLTFGWKGRCLQTIHHTVLC